MFIGRKTELNRLKEKNWRDKATFTVIYGRRRVGKTALVEKAYEDARVWKFEGIEGENQHFQLRNFLYTLSKYNTQEFNLNPGKIDNWQDALIALDSLIKDKELILFFDEFQWMAGMRKKLVAIFKWAWDNYLSKHPQCRVILCGSISSFMVRNVLRSRALYGRIDIEIHLKPLTVTETPAFFPDSKINSDILETYFVTGGVPQYLIELNPDQSIIQNLTSLAFQPHGYFLKEYNRLFISHFGKNDIYEKILNALSQKNRMTAEDLTKQVNYSAGGQFSRFLEDLELADFIQRIHPVDKEKKSKLLRYRLKDEFLHFYYRFIHSNAEAIEGETIHAYQILSGHSFEQWRGYAFERLCVTHARAIADSLKFSGINYKVGPWFRSDKKHKAQIDLLFIRADNVITVCEMKYVTRLSYDIVESFEKRIEVVRQYFTCGIQKVLVCGKKISIPEKVSDYFEEILFADDLFFD